MISEDSQPAGRVLVADDDPSIICLVKAIIEREGFTAVITRDGGETLRLLQHDADFDLVIFDMVMPHIEGPELVRYMQTEKRLKGIPVMIMTAEESPKLASESYDAGAVVFIPKPFSPTQVQSLMRMLVNRRAPKSVIGEDETAQGSAAKQVA